MKDKLLKKVYAPESFREQGHLLIDTLADHLEVSLHGASGQSDVVERTGR